MRRHRERQRKCLRCLTIELREVEIDQLIRRKRLSPDYRANPNAVGQALERYLDYTMSVTRNAGHEGKHGVTGVACRLPNTPC